MQYKVISDLHGDGNAFNILLESIKFSKNSKSQKLIFIGDLINRGEHSLYVLREVMKLTKENKNVQCLMGNHEIMFLNFLLRPYENQSYLSEFVGGMEIVKNIINEGLAKGVPEKTFTELIPLANYILENYQEEINFIKTLPYYIETKEYIFVHAGIEVYVESMKKMDTETMIWGSDFFIREQNSMAKKIVFGHLPTQNLGVKGDIWFKDNKIGIDGGGFIKDGKVNALIIDTLKDHYINFSYQKDSQVLTKSKYDKITNKKTVLNEIKIDFV